MDEQLVLRQIESVKAAIGVIGSEAAPAAAGRLAGFTEQLRRLEATLATIRTQAIQPTGPASPYSLAGQGGSLAAPTVSPLNPIPVEVVRFAGLPELAAAAAQAGQAVPGSLTAPASGQPAASPAAAGGEQRTIGEVYADQQKRVEALVAREKERAKYLASPAGLAMLQQQVKAARELAAAQREARYAAVAADQGAMAAGLARLNDQTEQGRQRLVAFTAAAQNTYSAGASAIMSLVAAGDPFSTWPTFQASVEGLSISIGQTLIPYVDMASGAVQRLTKWFDGLTDTQKSWTATILVGSTALAGTVVVGAKVVTLLGSVVTAARAAAAAMATLNAAAGPWGWAALGIGAATAGLITYAGAWGSVADKAKEAGGAIAGAIGAGADAAGRAMGAGGLPRERAAVTPADLRDRRVPIAAQEELVRAGNDPAKLAAVLETQSKAAADRAAEAQRKAIAAGAEAKERDAAGEAIVRDRLAAARAEEERISRERRPVGPGAAPRFADTSSEAAAALMARRTLEEMRAGGKVKAGDEGETLAELTQRFKLALDGLKYDTVAADRAGASLEAMAAEAKSSADYLKALRERAGVLAKAAGGEPAPDSPEGIQRSLRGLPQAQISDNQSYADRLTVAALSGSDLDNANRQKMLSVLEGSKDLMSDMAGSMRDVATRLNFPKSWR